jgi:hypothetical protein
MTLEQLLTDKPLCALGAGLLILWAWARTRRPSPQGSDPLALTTTLIRIVCGSLLVLASYDKLGDPAHFAKAVENYQVLPAGLVPLAAVVLPWLEFFTGLCLALGWRHRAAAWVLCLLMGAYALSLSVNLLRGVEMSCSCFSKDSLEKVTGWTVLRDIFLLALGWFVLTSRTQSASMEALLERFRRR